MPAFTAINKAPGVYIQEVTTLGPIAGVATSTAAFVGPARRGVIRTPVRLANWNEFVEHFGEPDDLGPYLPQPLIQVTPAVAGFFANGGADCWFVRVGSAQRSSLTLTDRSPAGNATLVVEAKTEGVAGDAITVSVQAASIDSTVATREETTLGAASVAMTNQVQVPAEADAKRFRVDDRVVIDDGTNSDRARVTAITGTALAFAAPLGNAYAAGTSLRIADLDVGQRSIRVDDVSGFEPGSGVALTQDGTTETNVVSGVDDAGEHLTLERGLTNAFDLTAAATAVAVATQEFTLVVGGTEIYPELSLDPRHSRYFAAIVDSPQVEVRLADDPPNSSRPPDNLPADLAATPLANGAEDDPSAVTANDYKAGIDALRTVDEVNMLCVPDRTDQDVQVHMIDHCESLGDRFAILDPQPRADSAAIRAQRELLGSDGGYAALYYPRIAISDPRAPGRITVAPSGHVAGLYARVDDQRGVFKAPANEALDGVLDLERTLVDETQGPLNERGVNIIRRFPGRGVVVWGARTISTATPWRYVNVRRLLLFIEESLQEGTQFVVFEPNTSTLWEQVKRQVTEFLTRQWTAGALVGATAADAFQVICDASLNPPASMALGQLVIEVRLYPPPPAEFVVFRIIQRPGGPEIQE
jgi:phage tail sheath protein FI